MDPTPGGALTRFGDGRVLAGPLGAWTAMVKTITTARLELVAATASHLDAELASPEALGGLLGVRVPASWPPGQYDRAAIEYFRLQLARDPSAVGWYGWYAIHRAGATLIGAAGYFGPPSSDGTVEIGYSITPEFRGRGLAAEITEALVEKAFSGPTVRRVIAQAQESNVASTRVLERAGFTCVGPGREPGAIEYERCRPIVSL